MNRLWIYTPLLALSLVTGCSKTTAFDFFSTNAYYEKAVSNTQKAALMSNMETRALIYATYLNNVDQASYYEGEYFFIALHIIHDAKNKSKQGLNNPAYTLKIKRTVPSVKSGFFEANENNETGEYKPYIYENAVEITALDPNDPLRSSMPIKNKWNSYYLVKFNTIKDAKLVLEFGSDQYGKAQLNFLKDQ